MNHFNELTPAEAERLAILAEECGECIQIIGKILRHGYDSCHPDKEEVTNRMMLEREIGDVQVAVVMLIGARDINSAAVQRRCLAKSQTIKRYLHHQAAQPGAAGEG